MPQPAVSNRSNGCALGDRLFDHLVGDGEKRGRNVEAECLGSRQIDDKIELRRLLDRDIGGFGSAQDLVEQLGGALEQSRSLVRRT